MKKHRCEGNEWIQLEREFRKIESTLNQILTSINDRLSKPSVTFGWDVGQPVIKER